VRSQELVRSVGRARIAGQLEGVFVQIPDRRDSLTTRGEKGSNRVPPHPSTVDLLAPPHLERPRDPP